MFKELCKKAFGLKLGEMQGLQKGILVTEKSQVSIFRLIIQTPLSPSISGLFNSFTHSFTLSFIQLSSIY